MNDDHLCHPIRPTFQNPIRRRQSADRRAERRPAVRRPLSALGQGQEPRASRNGARYGLLLMTDTVWIYVNTNKEVGDKDHLKVFATEDAAEIWFGEHDPEGVAFEYEVISPE